MKTSMEPQAGFWRRTSSLQVFRPMITSPSQQHRFGNKSWLVVYLPLWKIWVRQWEGWHPIYEMENKSHVWNHQPVIINHYILTIINHHYPSLPIITHHYPILSIQFGVFGSQKKKPPVSSSSQTRQSKIHFGCFSLTFPGFPIATRWCPRFCDVNVGWKKYEITTIGFIQPLFSGNLN